MALILLSRASDNEGEGAWRKMDRLNVVTDTCGDTNGVDARRDVNSVLVCVVVLGRCGGVFTPFLYVIFVGVFDGSLVMIKNDWVCRCTVCTFVNYRSGYIRYFMVGVIREVHLELFHYLFACEAFDRRIVSMAPCLCNPFDGFVVLANVVDAQGHSGKEGA
jgi:hypothetical protein